MVQVLHYWMWLMLTIYLNRGPDKLSYSFETMVQRFFHYIGKKSSNSKPIAQSHLTFTRYKTFPFFHLHSQRSHESNFLKTFSCFWLYLLVNPPAFTHNRNEVFHFPWHYKNLLLTKCPNTWKVSDKIFLIVKCILYFPSEISTLLDSSAINMHIQYPK